MESVASENPLAPVSMINGSNMGDNFGWNVSWAGDINGDGYDDIIVGAPYTDCNSSGWSIDWWDINWKYRKKLTFDNSGQSEPLKNFPVLVNLSPSNFNYSKAKSNGTDLRFIDSDGITELKYHIEKWNTSGESNVWVNVTKIAASSSTDHIWIYYNNSAASDVQDESGTYDENYVMVQHLEESPGDNVQGHYDSTNNNNDGTPRNFQDGGVGFTNAAGRIDGADYFDGNDDYVDCGNDSSFNITDAITIEAWVYGYNFTGYHRAVYKLSSFLFRPTDGSFNSYLYIDGAIRNFETNVPINTDEWLHLTFTYDSITRTSKKYLNGDLRSEKTLSGLSTYIINSSLDPVFIGGPTQAFNGTIDEVRISNTARSSDWICAQYLSMNNNFIAYGSEETKGTDAGAAYIFFGYPGMSQNDIKATNANVTIYGENAGDHFGWSVSDLGNVNSDPMDDVIIGAPGSYGESFEWDLTDVRVNQGTFNNQHFPAVGVDSDGNTIVVWYDYRNGIMQSDIYSQKLNSSDGLYQWGSSDNKVNRHVDPNAQYSPDMAVDQDGNAIFVWYDQRNGDWDIYAQKFNSTGDPQWNITDDVKVNQYLGANQNNPTVAVDSKGNAIVVWFDDRNGNVDIYAQKLSGSNGTALWNTTDDVIVTVASFSQLFPDVAVDSEGNAIVVWHDSRGLDRDIYAQKLNSTGDRQWIPDKKVNQHVDSVDQEYPAVAVDPSGDAIVVWQDPRNLGVSGLDTYAQKLNSTGDPQWSTTEDVKVNQHSDSADQSIPALAVDSSGNAVVVWQDKRDDPGDIYAQKLNSTGDPQWSYSDKKINQYSADDQRHPDVVVDSEGDVIVAWTDSRGGAEVYAQKYHEGGPDRGRVYIFYGRAFWNASYDAPSADVIITGENHGDRFGSSVSGAGNVDNSGYNDIIVGSPYNDGLDWWNSDWSYRNKLTFDNSGQSEALVNFPVLVNLSSSNFDYSKAKVDGTDLRFIDADDITELKYHIEHWNPLGYSYAWVNVTNIAANSDTDFIWMYYGNSYASDDQDESGTYDDNYVMVQHLDESPDDDVKDHYDSTGYDNDGTPKNFQDGGNGSTNSAGKIDGTDHFDGIDDYIDCGNDSSLNLTDEITIEFWWKPRITMNSSFNRYIMFIGKSSDYVNNGYGVSFRHDSGKISGYVWNGSSVNCYANKNNWTANTWHHIAYTVSSSARKIYVNGILETSRSGVVPIGGAANLYISTTSWPINGTIDEVRISNRARSTDWICAQYLSMNNSFITFDSEETKNWWNSDWSYRKKLTFDNSRQSETLENFPVLIKLSSSNFDYSKAKPDGADLRFIDADDIIELKYHIENWNPLGYSYVWVNVVNIAANSDTDFIWMYYGNSYAIDVQDESGTYDTNYVMVQHLEESPDDNVKGHYDSTGNNNDGAPINFTESGNGSTNAAGKIDGADDFYGGDNYIDCGNDESLNITGPLTLETWIKPAMVHEDGLNYGVMSKAIANPFQWSWQLRFGRETALTDSLGFHFNTDLGNQWVHVNQNLTVGQWYHVAGVFNGSDAMMYLNGVLKNTTSFSSINGSGAPFFIGQEGWDQFFNGTIDEVRISNTARSVNWIKAQYLSMNNRFITYGGEDSTNKGRAYIFYGDGSIPNQASNADVIITGEADGDMFGFSVSKSGDVNNDNYHDIIVGAPGYSSDKGRAYIIFGNDSLEPEISASNANVTLKGENPGDKFGWSVGNVSDIDQDGAYDDVIVGAPCYDGQGWWDSSWSYRKKLVFDNSGQTEDLESFPVLINLSSLNFDYSKAKLDGSDLRFIDADGVTGLKYHIEDWDPSGSSYVWVKVTKIDAASSNDHIWMYYGNSDASDIQDEEGTYDNDYVMVQHLEETSETHYDSTQYDNDGTEYIDSPGTQDASGKIAGADDFDGIDDYVDCGNDTSLDIIDKITLEAWIKPKDISTQDRFIYRRYAYNVRVHSTGQIHCYPYASNGSFNSSYAAIYTSPQIDEWYHVVCTIDTTLGSDQTKLYINGVLVDTATSDASINTSDENLYISGAATHDYIFNGTIDEVRISNTARSADWISAQYLSMNNSFITYGGEETKIWWNSDWPYRKKMTFNNSGQSKDLENFPVLVNLSSSNFDYSKAKSDGTDLRFIDADGVTVLKYHIEDWNPSGSSYVWVNVTNIDASSSTDHIWMYYDNSDASDVQDEEGAYDTNYTMVYHMKDYTTSAIDDSTGYDNDGTKSGANEPIENESIIGKGQDFDGLNDFITCGNDDSLKFNDTMTIECWLYLYDELGSHSIVDRTSYHPYIYHIGAGGALNKQRFYIRYEGGGGDAHVSNTALTLDKWNYLAMTWNRTDKEVSFYLNGNEDGGGVFSNEMESGYNILQIGRFTNGGMWMNGTMDEVRLSNVERSPDWISAQYLSMNNSFITYGSEEAKNRGRAYIFYGDNPMSNSIDASKANITLTGENSGDQFGFSVHSAGDINGDGVPDVVVGVPYYDNEAAIDAGAVYVFEGGATMDNATDWIYKGEQAGDHFGFSVSYAADMNGDGLTDITVGAPDNGDEGANAGKAYLLTSASKPVITDIVAIPSTQFIGGFVNITCNVFAPSGINIVQVNITLPDGGYTRENMTNDTGDMWHYNSTFFSPGIYQFTIWANETYGSWTESGTFQFNILNRVPILSQEKVDPDTGFTDTWFNFTVAYTDLDNHNPNTITVNITGVGVYSLIEADLLDIDYTDGKEYYYNVSGLAVGSYPFHFAANDTLGSWTESIPSVFEVFNRVPNLSLDKVDPVTGNIDTWFNFTVTYTDLDNHAPETITVNITGIGVYNLIELNPSDTDYTDGRDYYYNLSGFTLGQYSFHFAANDSLGNWTERFPSVFDVLNRAPILSKEKVDPTIGFTDTWFNFTVNYTDLDNHNPDIITVNISGIGVFGLIEVNLSDADYMDGKEYYHNLTLQNGSYSFHFAANDSVGLWAQETPEIDTLNVTRKHGSLDANDCNGEFSDEIQFNANLFDDDNNPISDETVNFYIDENKNGIYEAGELIGTGRTLGDGSVSVIYTTYLAPDTYNFAAVYTGSGNYSVDFDEALLIIDPKQATLSAISDVGEEGEDTFLAAVLIDDDGDPIDGEQVAFYIDKMKNGIYEGGDFIGFGTTSTGGIASVDYHVDLIPQYYNVRAEYKGSANYLVNEIEGLLTVQNTSNNLPRILWTVPNQIRPEDSLPWALALTPYENDIEDSGPDLTWYLTGIDTTLYSVTGLYSSDDVFTFIPEPDAYGNDEVTLWLMDSSNATVSQVLWINITPVNDLPYFDPLPPNLFVRYDDPSILEDDPDAWDYTFYVHDIETPLEDLIITTSEPTVDSGYGYAEVDGLNVTFHYPEGRVGDSFLVTLTLSDGSDYVQTMIMVEVTSDWVPEKVKKLPDVILEENSTSYNVFDLDEYFTDRDNDILFYTSGYFHIEVDINENNTVDITALGEWSGSEYVTFRAKDPIGAIAEDTIIVTVIPVNNIPVISGVPDLVVHFDYSYAFDLSPYIYDPDTPTSDLEIWTSESTEYIWLQQYNKLGIVINYPESMNGMAIPVTISVSDGNEITYQQIQINITSDFPPELINNLPDVSFEEDTILRNAFFLNDYFHDVDGDILFYTNGTKFINVTINENLTVTFSAPENWYGSEFVTFRATDPYGALSEDKILVVVVPVNDPPTIRSIPRQEKKEGDQWVLDLFQYIDDIDSNSSELIITMENEMGQGCVILVGSILIFQYSEGVYSDIITITVNDTGQETNTSFEVSISSSVTFVPTIWDLIPWPWISLLIVVAVSGAYTFYRKRSRFLVYEVFLIHEKGLPIAHVSRVETSDLENVVVSGMFTAVQDFINDAFSGKTSDDDWELDEMKFGDNKILIERSQDLYLAVIFEGNGGKLRNHVKKLLMDIDKEYGAVLEDWDGDMTRLKGISEVITPLITKKGGKNLVSEDLLAQPDTGAQGEELEDAMMDWGDKKEEVVKDLEDLLVSIEEAIQKDIEIQEVEVLECPVCGIEVNPEDTKCPRCEIEFVDMDELSALSSRKLDDQGLRKSQSENEDSDN